MVLAAAGTQSFDRLTRLAAGLLSAPVAVLISFGLDGQNFLSAYGLPGRIRSARQTTLEYSIRQFRAAGGRPVILNDTTRDLRLGGHPAVTELGVAAYAGMPLLTASGSVRGALAVLDFEPRDWTGDGLAILANLATVSTEELRGQRWLENLISVN